MNEEFDRSLESRRRDLSRFLAQELVLDYATDQLDPDRRRAVEEYLPRCKDTQAALAAVRSGLDYSDKLAGIEISPRLIEQISNTKLGWAKWSDRIALRNWPDVARWSLEAVVVAGLIAAAVSLLPLYKIARWLPKPAQEVILAEVSPEPQFARAPTEPSAQQPVAASAPTVAAPEEHSPYNVPLIPAAVEPKPAAEPKPTVAAGIQSDRQTGEPASKGAKGPKGVVYRAFMSSKSIDTDASRVRDLVLALGGEKAGQVDLGWRKATGTYFHFSLPESNYDSLIEQLRGYGPVRIYKEPHWRVMPEGQIRLILFIEDLSLKK